MQAGASWHGLGLNDTQLAWLTAAMKASIGYEPDLFHFNDLTVPELLSAGTRSGVPEDFPSPKASWMRQTLAGRMGRWQGERSKTPVSLFFPVVSRPAVCSQVRCLKVDLYQSEVALSFPTL